MGTDFFDNALIEAVVNPTGRIKRVVARAQAGGTEIDYARGIVELAACQIVEAAEFLEKYYAFKAEQASWKYSFLGTPISPHMYGCYQECNGCGRLAWRKSHIIGLCPHCAMLLPEFALEVSFGRSTSKKYRTALKRAREIPSYINEGDRHIVRFGSIGEYSDSRHKLEKLMLVIFRWKSVDITLNGENTTADGIGSLRWEIDRVRDLAGAKAITFVNGMVVLTPKDELVPGEVFSADYTHPDNVTEVGENTDTEEILSWPQKLLSPQET